MQPRPLEGRLHRVISKRLIPWALIKTIHFPWLKITRALIVASNEKATIAAVPVYQSFSDPISTVSGRMKKS